MMSAHSASHASRPPRLLMAAMALLLPGTAALVLLARLDVNLITMAAYGLTVYAAWRAGRTWFLGAGLGALLIALSSQVVSFLLHHGINAYVSWDDPLRILGCWLWYRTIRALPQRRTPRLTRHFLAILSAATLLFMGYLVAITGRIPWDIACFAFLGLLLLSAAAPLLEAWLYAEAPSGRFFWIFGWLLWWFAHCPLMADETSLARLDLAPLTTIFFLSAAFQALGILAEARRWNMGLWPFILGNGSMLLAWAAGFVAYRPLPLPVFCAWLVLGGLLFLPSATGLLMNQLQSIRHKQRLLAGRNAVLDRTSKTKSAALVTVSQALHAPLGSMMACSTALEQATTLDEMQRDLLGEIHTGITRLLTMVRRIEELATLQAGKTTLQRSSIHLPVLCQRLLASHEADCQAHGITLSVHLPEVPITIQGDSALLERMLHELLDNAIHACKTAGGGTVTITATSSPDGVQLDVHDTGGGLRQDHSMELSQILGRQEGFVNRLELGLSLAREIAAAHGGTLHVGSTPGQGTTATVHLPHAPLQKRSAWRPEPVPGQKLQAPSPVPRWLWHLLAVMLLIPCATLLASGRHDALFTRLFVGGCDFLAAAWSWSAGGVWRWLAGGLFLWMMGEWWAPATPLLDPAWQGGRVVFFHAGYALLAMALLRATPRHRIGWMDLVALSILGSMGAVAVVQLLAHEGWPNVRINYTLLNLLALCCATPLIQAAIVGQAPTGRLLWLFGLLINLFLENALSVGNLGQGVALQHFIYNAYGLSALLLGAGALAEARNWSLRTSVMFLGVGGLMFTWCLGATGLREQVDIFWFWVVSGALVLFQGTFTILAHHRARLAALTTTLHETRARLEEADAAQARFLAALSHHLRTPLNAILGFAEALRDEMAGPWPQELMDPLQQIQKEAEHILVATQDLLEAEPAGC